MASLDMSLDDMIKNRRNSDTTRGGRGRGRRGRGSGRFFSGGRMREAPLRGPLSVNARPSSHVIAKSFRRTKSFPWQRELFDDSLRAAGLTGVENGTKLSISNLDSGVSNDDIRELFSEMGELIRYAIHYDKNGRPSGSAEVVFARRTDAFQALKRYNNVQLDGRPMKIELINTSSQNPVSARINVVGGVNGGRRTVVLTPGVGRGRGSAVFNPSSGRGMGRGRGSAINHSFGQRNRGVMGMRNVRGGGGGGRGSSRGGGLGRGRGGGGRGMWRKKAVEKSADELDQDLDKYNAQAMQS